jgi:hypothetical protein
MSKLDTKTRKNQKKKMTENKWKLEKEEAERLEAQKKQKELCLQKIRKIIESPTQSPVPSSNLPPRKSP